MFNNITIIKPYNAFNGIFNPFIYSPTNLMIVNNNIINYVLNDHASQGDSNNLVFNDSQDTNNSNNYIFNEQAN